MTNLNPREGLSISAFSVSRRSLYIVIAPKLCEDWIHWISVCQLKTIATMATNLQYFTICSAALMCYKLVIWIFISEVYVCTLIVDIFYANIVINVISNFVIHILLRSDKKFYVGVYFFTSRFRRVIPFFLGRRYNFNTPWHINIVHSLTDIKFHWITVQGVFF